jgi:hypothetical protein
MENLFRAKGFSGLVDIRCLFLVKQAVGVSIAPPDSEKVKK